METQLTRPPVSRQEILELQDFLSEVPGAVFGNNDLCPLKHSFTEGIYIREIFIPKDMYVVGRIHKFDHPNFLVSGRVRVITEYGSEELHGPVAMISQPGTKRALYTITDIVWITVHHNPKNLRDVDQLEDFILAASYEDYEKFKSKQSKEIKL